MRRQFGFLVAILLCHSYWCLAQWTVVQSPRASGFGVCLDTPCLHVLTNYHVVAAAGQGIRVNGVPVTAIQTGLDKGALGTMRMLVGGRLPIYLDPARDLAALTLESPLAIPEAVFAGGNPTVGEAVRRSPVEARGTLAAVRVRYGLRVASMVATDFDSPPGNSGSTLLNDRGEVVGLISGADHSVSVPVSTIAKFLAPLHLPMRIAVPIQTAQLLFPVESGELTIPDAEQASGSEAAVAALRWRAKVLLASMQRVIGVQTVQSWGPGVPATTSPYEIALFESGARFRPLDGALRGSELEETVPLDKPGVVPGDEWSYLLHALDRTPLRYTGLDHGQHIFEFKASAEQSICRFRENGPSYKWAGAVACTGRIAADTEFNPVTIATTLRPARHLGQSEITLQVRFERRRVGSEEFLLPVGTDVSSKFRAGGRYSASAVMSDYRVFSSSHTISFNSSGADADSSGE